MWLPGGFYQSKELGESGGGGLRLQATYFVDVLFKRRRVDRTRRMHTHQIISSLMSFPPTSLKSSNRRLDGPVLQLRQLYRTERHSHRLICRACAFGRPLPTGGGRMSVRGKAAVPWLAQRHQCLRSSGQGGSTKDRAASLQWREGGTWRARGRKLDGRCRCRKASSPAFCHAELGCPPSLSNCLHSEP